MLRTTRIVVPVVTAALALAACGSNTQQAADNAVNATGEALSGFGNTAEQLTENAMDALTPTPNGQDFANTAAKSDAFEIAAGKLATTKAASADVKAFAAEMVKAHTESTGKIKEAASKASPAITPDPTLTADQNQQLADLGALSGAQFDRKYVEGQIDAHNKALALMRAYAKDGDTPSLKAAAGEIAPIVEMHLSTARDLEEKVR